jgi:hypothetical protein
LNRIITSSRIAVSLAALCFTLGCGKQGEGERCDPANGSLDCDTGLVCRDATELGLGAQGDLRGAALCCPPADGTTPSVDVCRGEAVLPGEDEAAAQPPPAQEPVVDAGSASDAAPAP